MNKNKTTLVAALSGGVDSSVAASIYIEQGYNVIGVTLKMKSCDDTHEKTKACCGLDDNIQARLVAEKLGISHYFLDVRPLFKEKILDYAWREYISGRTPNPCILCNRYLKFGALLDFAKQLGAKGVITGHYAVVLRSNNEKTKIFRGIDKTKDQTYFLSALTQEQLNCSYMPLGEMTKKDVRLIAEKLKLPNANKKESQDACFGYKGETFAETLARLYKNKSMPGNIVTKDNKIIGEHNGIQNFTIGQRKGLKIALGKPAYVMGIDAIKNTVIVSTNRDDLFCEKFTASDMNWLDFNNDKLKCEVQTRYRQSPYLADVYKKGDSALVIPVDPIPAVTPGQGLAVYKDKQLIAGGWID